MTTPPNPATTGPDIIEAAINNVVATARAGVPVKLCRIDSHHHTKAGRQVLCTSRGKVPVESKWQERTPDDTMPRIFEWMEQGHPVGLCLDRDLIGLDEDLVGGLARFFGAVNEPVPVTMGDIVPYSGKQHLIVRKPDGFDASRLTGTFYLPDGTKIGELIHDRNKQLVAPGCEWISADGKHRDWRVWNQIDTFATLSLAAAEALVPPTKGFGFSSAQGSLSYGESPALKVLPNEPDWTWDQSMEARHVILLGETLRLRGALDTNVNDVAERAWAWGERHGLTGVHPDTGREVTFAEVVQMAEGAFEGFEADIKLLDIPRIEKGAWQTPKVDVNAIPLDTLIVPVADYHAQNSTIPEWVSPLAAYGHVSLVSGPPKSGKSTLISNLFTAREQGTVFLWGDPVPPGPMLLVTEEGGFTVVRKTQGLTTLDILDRMAFITHGLRSLDHLLAAMQRWVDKQTERALVVIDTLAVWGDIKDENDAVAATRSVTTLRVWAQSTQSAIPLLHHTRKGGGVHGEAIRGSGGIFAAVDQSVELGFTNDALSDDRTLEIAGRLAFGETKVLAFDRPTTTYDVTSKIVTPKHPVDQFPLDGAGGTGWTNVEAGGEWGMAPTSANKHLKDLVDTGVLVARREQAPGSRALHLAYWRARPLLDLSSHDSRSVSETMADIFNKEPPE